MFAVQNRSSEEIMKDIANLKEPVKELSIEESISNFLHMSFWVVVLIAVFLTFLVLYKIINKDGAPTPILASLGITILSYSLVIMLFLIISAFIDAPKVVKHREAQREYSMTLSMLEYDLRVAQSAESQELRTTKENAFVDEKIMEKYSFKNDLKKVYFTTDSDHDFKPLTITAVYDDLDSGISYDLYFVVDNNGDPKLMSKGNVSKEFIDSVKK